MRFRLTAEPTLLLTTMPIRAIREMGSNVSATGCFATSSVKCGVATRRPRALRLNELDVPAQPSALPEGERRRD
jgi:hypothetical protein